MSDIEPVERRRRQITRILRLDAAAIDILRTLASHDIPALLLKGASFRTWLYPTGGRSQVDVDILVPQSLWDLAVRDIERREFVYDRSGPTGGNWYRRRDQVWLDLHYTLVGVGVTPAELWATLWSEQETMVLHHAMVPILTERARLFHVALHAIQTGNARTKPAEDLARAATVVPFERWHDAWILAKTLGAERPFAAALRLYAPGGAALADRLGAPRHVPWLEYVHAIEHTPAAMALIELLKGTWRQRYAVLKRCFCPSPEVIADLERGKFPQVPAWVRRCPSPFLRFYLWRGCEVLTFLRTWPAARRLHRAADRRAYRQTISQPWWDDR